jgi:hypothetical protein
MGQARIECYILAALHVNHLPSTYACSRLIGFGACLLGAAVCFFVAFLTAPLIPIRPAKFALALRSVHILPRSACKAVFSLFLCSSLGSILVMFGFVEYLARTQFSTTHDVNFPQLRRVGGAYHTPQTPRIQRAATFLRRLHC